MVECRSFRGGTRTDSATEGGATDLSLRYIDRIFIYRWMSGSWVIVTAAMAVRTSMTSTAFMAFTSFQTV
jgi:hypothetical protein